MSVRPLAGAAVVLVTFAWLYWEFLARQVRWAFQDQADWGHTLVIPLIAGYFVYLNRDRILARPFQTNWLGVGVLAAGIAWYSVCALTPMLYHHNLMAFGVWLSLVGLVLLFFGPRVILLVAFPLVYLLVFGQPVSERFMEKVTHPLQDLTARGSEVLLKVLGRDVTRDGNTLTLFANGKLIPLDVAEACSGMRMLMAFLALGVAMAHIGLKSFWQRGLLVISAVPTAIVVNVLRVVTLSLLSVLNVDFAAGDFHTFVGLVWLVPAFFIYLGVMWVIRNLVTEAEAAGSEARHV